MGDNPARPHRSPRLGRHSDRAHRATAQQMAQKARIPQPVIDIIRQHHGDCTGRCYFYDKAQKLYGDSRSTSPPSATRARCPQTREAAVVMLADGIEAAARRAMSNPDPEKIDALIRKIVRGTPERRPARQLRT